MTTSSRDERGFSESVQWALLVPLLMTLLLGAIQVGMLWHGHNTARHAAAAAAEIESVHQAEPGSGQPSARRIAAAGGLSDVAVRVTRGAGRVDVEVSATVPVLIDLGMARVTQQASAPIEDVR
ncbi:MAG TPA: hypothetical protein GXZ30_01655 [Propionibacterium sp.]|jgi:Flp pilus assembly protein TadG|nr:hypothetical protein [Propionibacterium sp.]